MICRKIPKLGFGLIGQGYSRASECIGCGQCEGVCPQHLPIIDLLKDASAKLDA